MGSFSLVALKEMAKHIALGQALAFLMSVTGISTRKLVDSNASYSLLQSTTSYLFIFVVYFPLYLFLRYKFRGVRFVDFVFLNRWYKYAILAAIDLEANFCVVLAYQYTDIMSIQLLNCFTVPCVLVLSFFVLKMRFALTHVLGCIVAVGGLSMLIVLDADGLSRSGGGEQQVLGDILCLLSSALYATSNVLTEWFIKPPKAQVLMGSERNETVAEAACRDRHSNDAQNSPVRHCRMAVEDEPTFFAALEADDGVGQELPNVPAYVPVVENLAVMSLFAVVFSTVQFFIVEWKEFEKNRDSWSGENWLFLTVFGLTMLCVYTGMPTLFLVTSASFANISLLTSSVYAIIWNVTIFKVYPTALFFAAYALIVVGILLYNLTDVVRIPCCKRFNYPCGEIVLDSDQGPASGEELESNETRGAFSGN